MFPGLICEWSGSIVSIPDGWALCDGNNGTPDLRDKFVVGAGSTYAPDATGGATTHTHDFTTDGHTHTIPAGSDIETGTHWGEDTNEKTDSGTTDPSSSLPPYYSLAYIMYL